MRISWCAFILILTLHQHFQIGVTTILVSDYDNEDNNLEDQLKTLEAEFAQFFGLKSYNPMNIADLKILCDELGITSELRTQLIKDRFMCGACQSVVRKLQTNRLSVAFVGTALCTFYISLSTLTLSDFCLQIVNIHRPIIEYILRESKILTPEYACSVLLQNENCYYANPALTWRIEIPEDDAESSSFSIPFTDPENSLQSNKVPLKILHLSDFHISFDYEVDGVSNCGYPVCCKNGLGNPIRGKNAGSWGDYNCDIPPWLFRSTLTFINNTHKDIDLIYFTGDIIDHTVWKASKEDNSREIQATFNALAESFPNISIMPAIGNHESVPLNVFAPPNIKDEYFNQKWLYKLNSEIFQRWIPNEGLENIKQQGYFSVLANYKLRIIVLNNNICYTFNWWLLYDTNFLKEQLEFLKNELLAAEIQGQYVHIISHVFPGTFECIEPWEVNYNSLITRFAHIIKGQFFGHTHTDGLKVFYSKIDGKPNNVGYNGASLTPFVKYNPNYKIIIADPDTFEVLDIETYYFNLTEANEYPNRTPRWQLLYSMKESYGFDSMSPENFDNFAKRMQNDPDLFTQYWRHFVRDGDASLREGCNQKCFNDLISDITRTESIRSDDG